MRAVRRALGSPWMILGLFAFAWVPIFIADFVRLARPDLAANSIPQGYGKQWLGVTAVFSGFGVMAAFIHAVRFVIWLVRPAKIIQTHHE